MRIALTPLADVGVTVLPPDVVWDGASGDFAVSTVPEDGGVGGFVAVDPLRSAVLMLLFSDARPQGYRPGREDDPRGWVGDGFDVAAGETPLGSELWRWRREALSEALAKKIALVARTALTPLRNQGLVDGIETEAAINGDGEDQTLSMQVTLTSRGETIFSGSWDLLWGRGDGGL